ncbi:MAG: ABC transporter substrate-binding protein [Eubacteriaceae bacterium]|nr:ABC transporter substrate-binding protein [Eubacteriaceae bacterium]
MKRTAALLLAAVLIAGLAAGCGQTGNQGGSSGDWKPVSVTDDLGRKVTIENKPEKTAVLLGSFAETWLLAGGSLCATVRDSWDDYKLDLDESVVNLGSHGSVNMELLFESEADFIIASANTKAQVELMGTFEKAGIPVLYFSVNSFEDYLRMLKVCTEITGRDDLYQANGLDVKERADAVIAEALDAAEKNGAPKVLFVRASAKTVKAKGSDDTVTGFILKDLGAINIADGSTLTDDLSIEKIIVEDPDFIFLVIQGDDEEGARKALSEQLTDNPAWAGLTAVKEGRVYFLPRDLYHFKPNARWDQAYEGIKDILYGQQ